MKIIICIQNYVDTIDVLIDGTKVDVSKITFFPKLKFACNVETGVHEIVVIKKSKISQHDWGKNVLLDWISCLAGIPDWTLAEKLLDTKKNSIILKVDVNQDIYIDLKLTESGLELIKKNECILDISQQTKSYKSAQKRIKNLYILPVIILVVLIELCILSASAFFY